jgi:hypothetical protein
MTTNVVMYEDFNVGDQVYLSTKRYKDYGSISYASKGNATVFEPHNLGPFLITQKISSHASKLKLPPSFRIHPVIRIRYLIKHREEDDPRVGGLWRNAPR